MALAQHRNPPPGGYLVGVHIDFAAHILLAVNRIQDTQIAITDLMSQPLAGPAQLPRLPVVGLTPFGRVARGNRTPGLPQIPA